MTGREDPEQPRRARSARAPVNAVDEQRIDAVWPRAATARWLRIARGSFSTFCGRHGGRTEGVTKAALALYTLLGIAAATPAEPPLQCSLAIAAPLLLT